jgi:hypothetical protein
MLLLVVLFTTSSFSLEGNRLLSWLRRALIDVQFFRCIPKEHTDEYNALYFIKQHGRRKTGPYDGIKLDDGQG